MAEIMGQKSRRAPSSSEEVKQAPKSFIGSLFEGAKALLVGYAQVFFATNWVTGMLFLLATFILPERGLAGFLGLVSSVFFAWVLGMPKEWIKAGYFSYNGLLQGLAIALIYEINLAFFALLFMISFIGVFVAAGLRFLYERFLGIPVLSLPFVITTWLMWAASVRFDMLKTNGNDEYALSLAANLPFLLDYSARSIAAAFFQLNALSGLVILLGIFIFSRHAFMLSLIGLATGSLFHLALGGSFTDLNDMWIGFNFALTAIAVGGIWIVPKLEAFALAALAAAACSIITAASYQLLSFLGLPVLAFPFVFTSSVFLYALRNRLDSKRFEAVFIPAESPEANLKETKNAHARFVTHQVPAFAMPVFGEWTITQSHNDKHTHKHLWAHALDFEILDEDGSAFENSGTKPSDFYAFQKPVFSPADGKVVKIVNHIEDNPIGQTNQADNWGNLVIIWHYGAVYTALCHLQKGSILVEEGETVHKGQRLGRVGNSGRSPIPHLHFQAQASHQIGSPTIKSELLNYIEKSEDGWKYHTHDIPKENLSIKSLDKDPTFFNTISFPLGKKWRFITQSEKGKQTETWKADIDFQGNRSLIVEETGDRLRIYVDNNVFMALGYKGNKKSGLYWLFMGVPRIPLTKEKVYWEDRLPGELLLSALGRFLFDVIEPVYEAVQLKTTSKFKKMKVGSFTVETKLEQSGFLSDNSTNHLQIITQFNRKIGLDSMVVRNGAKIVFEIRQVQENE